MCNNISAALETLDALACPQTQTDALSLVDVANNLIFGYDHRKHVFGNEFKPGDLVQL